MMAALTEANVRMATEADYPAVGRLLHRFNLEFDDPSPEPSVMAARVGELVAAGDTVVLIAGEGPDALVLLRFRANLWSPHDESYVAELYVVPEHRRHGLGQALMERAMSLSRERGCDRIELCTEETDIGARALYEKLGFVNHYGDDGALMLYYERDL